MRRLLVCALVVGATLTLGLAGASRSASVPAAPSGLTGIAEESAVGLAWQPVPGATAYVVYRGTTPTSVTAAVTPNGGVAGTSFTDSSAVDGTTYYYVVHASAAGVESPDSLVVQATPVHRACSTGNPVVLENCYPGNTPWNVRNTATVAAGGIEGYATAPSVEAGASLGVKVNAATGTTFDVEIYRTGYYGGAEARLFSVVKGVPAVSQPACVSDATTGLLSCSNWSTSLTISTTADWTSGVYVARLVRNDTGTDNQVLFVVRDDTRGASDILYGVGMATFQSYNNYGGKSLYDFNSTGNNTVAGTPRAVKVSYDRPFEEPRSGLRDWYTRTEIATVAWLEQSGYDVTYASNTDLDATPALARTHKVYFSPAHDEYVSAGMRTAMTQARDSGVSLFFSGGNADYWRIRFEADPGTGTPGRVQVCYKSTQSGMVDPSGIPTGTWRDPAGANLPENALIGIEYVGDNDNTYFPFVVSATQGSDRVFRYTGLDTQAAGTQTSLGTSLVGWEWDAPVNNGFEPSGVVRLSGSPVSGELIQNNGAFTTAGSTTVTATKYKAASGALVFATGTNHWNRGLAPNAYGTADLDTRIQQVSVNVLEDMGVVPSTPAPTIKLDVAGTGGGAAPTNVGAVGLGPDSVQVSWDPVAGASGYNVYRTLSPRSDGLPIGALANGAPLAGTSFTDIQLTPSTTYYYVVTAVTNGAQSTVSTEASATTGAAAGQTTRIDVGASSSYTASTGAVFQADAFATGGTLRSVSTPIAGTNDAKPFQTERWGQFTYAIPVTNGTYDVRFEFAETYFTGACAGQRVFGMDILNTPASPDLANVDICAAVGPATAYVRTVSGVQVTNGTLSIRSVDGSADDPTLEALEIVPQSPTAPTVTFAAPAAGATGVSPQVQPRLTFSRPMDPATIDGSTVTLATSAGAAVAAAVSYDSQSSAATIVPTAPLANSTAYTLRVSTGARSADGVGMTTPYTSSFTTAAPASPDVTSTSPADGAAGVSPFSAVRAVFSRPLDASTVTTSTFTLRSSDGALVPAAVSYDGPTQSATLSPSSALGTGVTYTARLGTAIMSSDGIPIAAPIVWSFTTAATAPAPPAVLSTAPAAAATGASERAPLTATVSRSLDPASVDATSVTLQGASGPVAATIAYDAASLTITVVPTTMLAPSTTYTATIGATVRAVDGTPLASPYSWSFTTSDPPTIGVKSPSAESSYSSRAAPVTVSFSRSMDPGSLTTSTMTLRDAGGTLVPAAVTYDDATRTATLQPTSLLQGGAIYTASVEATVLAADGAALGTAASWSFTTAACPCSLHSVVSQPASQNLAVRDGRAAPGPWSYELGVKLTVDEPMDLTSIRFFKSSAETGTHVGRVWTAGGVQLAAVTFAAETPSGWQNQALATPLILQPGTVYVVSVNANAYFAQTSCCSVGGSGLSNQIVSGPLRSVADGKNGVYGSSSGVFPTQSYHTTDYFVDVQAVPDGTPAPPAVLSASPAAGATAVGLRNVVSIAFSRSMDSSSLTGSTVALTDGSGNTVPVTQTFADATNTETLTPVEPLAYDTTYTVSVRGSVRASDGMPIGHDTTWTFRTVPLQQPLSVASATPADSATGVERDATVQVAFSRAVDPSTVTSSNVALLDPAGSAVAAAVSYDAGTTTATIQPTAALAPLTTYTVQLSTGVLAASDGTPLSGPTSWTFTTGSCPCSLFPSTLKPVTAKASVQDGRVGAGPWSYEMGVKFTVTQQAQLASVRFYKSAGETGTHTGTVWSSAGVKLATVAFSNETASGWQQATLPTPLTLQANTTYVVSVGLNAYYVSTRSGLATQVTGGIVQSVADAKNGVYAPTAGLFPTSFYSSSNYFVDVVVR